VIVVLSFLLVIASCYVLQGLVRGGRGSRHGKHDLFGGMLVRLIAVYLLIDIIVPTIASSIKELVGGRLLVVLVVGAIIGAYQWVRSARPSSHGRGAGAERSPLAPGQDWKPQPRDTKQRAGAQRMRFSNSCAPSPAPTCG
jgi:hypothetical protein